MNKNSEIIELSQGEYTAIEKSKYGQINKIEYRRQNEFYIQLVKIKTTILEDIVKPQTKKIKQTIIKTPIVIKANRKINKLKQTKLCKQIKELLQIVNEKPQIKKLKETPKKAKEKALIIKDKINNVKAKIKEMNENINKKTTVIITKKMINNVLKGQTYLNHAMASILLNKKLKKHPQRIELVYAIDKSIDYLSTKEALKLLHNDNIISNPQLLEIIQLVSKTTYPQCVALCFIANTFSQTNEENMLEIMELISQTEDYDCVKNAVSMATNSEQNAEEKLDLIKQIVKGDIYTSTLIKKLATDFKEQINGDLLETAELVNLYKCRSKLESAVTQMLGENGLLSDENLREKSIETLRHFKDYEEDETEMFSCIELYNEETDPTYDLEFDQAIMELEDMPNKQRTKVFRLIRRLYPVVKDIEKSQK